MLLQAFSTFYSRLLALSQHGLLSTAGAGNGRPLKYTSFGAAYSEVEINMLTGEKTLLRTDLFYDVGRSLNPAVDIGQVWLLRACVI